jgi:rhodanese-related sulfurtransferase
MRPRCLFFVLSGVLLISSTLNTGCTQAGPTTAAPSPSAFTQPAILPTGAPKPTETTAVTPAVPTINIQDAFKLIQNNQGNADFIIIDVRTADEFNNGHLASAINIDYYSSDFKPAVDKMDRSKTYLVYCRTGIRGEAATQIMVDLGFTRVQNLAGGIVEWVNAGYPTTK